jgi:mannose-6-phosphate isomerase-like protein (cupin superfamily)
MDLIKSANRYLYEGNEDKLIMKKVESHDGYDFYIGKDNQNTLYNIVPKGQKIPEGGYRNKEYIEKIKHVKFSTNESIEEADDENQEAPETPEAETAEGNSEKGFVTDIEKDTKANNDFRRVLYTGKTSQLVLMSLKANEDIGEEVHKDIDQFFRIDDGDGVVVINDVEHKIQNGSAFVVPQGAKHNIIAGENGLKLYSIYSPPNHKDGTIHKTKEDAQKAKEHFDGQTSEK